MSDTPVNYNNFFGSKEEVETVEVVNNEVLPVVDTLYVRAHVPSYAKLRIRKQPSMDGDILEHVVHGTLLEVLDSMDEDSTWYFVEAVSDSGPVKGYVKKKFVRHEPTALNEDE